MAGKNNDKVAVITIGRLQPPHKGRDVLIRDTVQLARDLGGDHLFGFLHHALMDEMIWNQEKFLKEQKTTRYQYHKDFIT